jgi:hypothetical protein
MVYEAHLMVVDFKEGIGVSQSEIFANVVHELSGKYQASIYAHWLEDDRKTTSMDVSHVIFESMGHLPQYRVDIKIEGGNHPYDQILEELVGRCEVIENGHKVRFLEKVH